MNVGNSKFSFMPSCDILGVRFFWATQFAKINSDHTASGKELNLAMVDFTREHMQRQKRKRFAHWDAYTFLEQAPPDLVPSDDETALAQELITMFGRKHLRDPPVQELIDLPLFEHVYCHLAYDHGHREPDPSIVSARTDPARITHAPDGSVRLVGPGFYRLPAVDMVGAGIKSTAIDWQRLTIWATLIQLRADLEIFFETGFRPVGRCERRLCQAWFKAQRRGRRARFCSTYCRVAHNREIAPSADSPRAAQSKRRSRSKPTRT